jgi:hypothetical protein
MRWIIAAVTSVLLGAAAPYNAALGVGDKTCAGWLKDRSKPTSAEAARQWVFGLISGTNINASGIIIMTEEGEGLVQHLDEICAANLTRNVMSAAVQLRMETIDARIRLMKRSADLMKSKP